MLLYTICKVQNINVRMRRGKTYKGDYLILDKFVSHFLLARLKGNNLLPLDDGGKFLQRGIPNAQKKEGSRETVSCFQKLPPFVTWRQTFADMIVRFKTYH